MSTPMRVARVAFVVVGIVAIGVGGAALIVGVPVGQWRGILLWLAAAVVLHDAVLAPLVLVGTRLLRRVGARVSWVGVAIVQIAVVIGAAVTLIAIPGIGAQRIGARNPSVLVSDYGPNLAIAWGLLGVLSAALIIGLGLRRRALSRR